MVAHFGISRLLSIQQQSDRCLIVQNMTVFTPKWKMYWEIWRK
jgi:hypothetical protein